jgi:hypothetical protein
MYSGKIAVPQGGGGIVVSKYIVAMDFYRHYIEYV